MFADLSLREDSVLGVASMSHPLVFATPIMVDVNHSVHTSLTHPLASRCVCCHRPWTTVRETYLPTSAIDHVVILTPRLSMHLLPSLLGLHFLPPLSIVFGLWVVDGVHTQDAVAPPVSKLPIAFVDEHGSLFYL